MPQVRKVSRVLLLALTLAGRRKSEALAMIQYCMARKVRTVRGTLPTNQDIRLSRKNLHEVDF
jgi:hypothetical protein